MRIARTELARLLAHCLKAVESRNTMPILSSVRLVAGDGELTVSATDLDILITASAPAEGDIAICVEARVLGDIVKKVSGDDITLDADDGRVVVKSGRSRFTLPYLPVDDFPTIPTGDMPEPFDVDLAALFAPVKFAISTEETRYYLNGVFLQPTAATATDGHRLSTVKADLPEFQAGILPHKLVELLPAGQVSFSMSGAKVRIEKDGAVIVSKLIDGQFPDYQRVIPSGNDKLVAVDRDSLMRAVDRVAVISDDRARAVKLSIAPGQVELAVRGDAEANDVVETDYSGEPVDIGFNAKYLRDVLGSMPVGPVTLALNDGGAPALFTSSAQDGLRIVLMPMRVS